MSKFNKLEAKLSQALENEEISQREYDLRLKALLTEYKQAFSEGW